MTDYKSLGLSKEGLKVIYKWMDLGRKIDEGLWLLNRVGKIPFVVSGQGQEATQIGMAYALKEGDITAPYYRDLAFIIHIGISAYDMLLLTFGREDNVNSGGEQMPPHFSNRTRNVLSQSSPVATQIPHAVGAALALEMDGKEKIATATVGEGSSSQGDSHESLNFANVRKLPFVCVIINDKCAISVPNSLQYAAEKLSDRALGYDMRDEQVGGNGPLAMYKAMKETRDRAISGQGSTLIETVTSRMAAHSSDGDDQYRTREEREALRKAGCNEKFRKELLPAGITDDVWSAEIEAKHKDIISKAAKAAEDTPYPSVEEAYAFVYEERSLN